MYKSSLEPWLWAQPLEVSPLGQHLCTLRGPFLIIRVLCSLSLPSDGISATTPAGHLCIPRPGAQQQGLPVPCSSIGAWSLTNCAFCISATGGAGRSSTASVWGSVLLLRALSISRYPGHRNPAQPCTAPAAGAGHRVCRHLSVRRSLRRPSTLAGYHHPCTVLVLLGRAGRWPSRSTRPSRTRPPRGAAFPPQKRQGLGLQQARNLPECLLGGGTSVLVELLCERRVFLDW